MINYVFYIILIFKVMHFVFFNSLFLTKEIFFLFPFTEYTFLDCKQYRGAGIDTFMSISDGLGPSILLSKYGNGASYERRDGWKCCLFPTRVGIFNFDVMIYKVFFPICTLSWRVNNYVSHQRKV